MARINILAVIVAAFIMMATFISPTVATTYIGYPAIGKGRGKGNTPPGVANPYERPCGTPEKCRED
ncbi:hypothetical protein ABFX02_07G070900 [Erythranthe guttata]